MDLRFAGRQIARYPKKSRSNFTNKRENRKSSSNSPEHTGAAGSSMPIQETITRVVKVEDAVPSDLMLRYFGQN